MNKDFLDTEVVEWAESNPYLVEQLDRQRENYLRMVGADVAVNSVGQEQNKERPDAGA
jgi:hypothetical protein